MAWHIESGAALLFAARLLLGVTVVWTAAAAATRLLSRRGSAAMRHRVWAASTAAALVLPALLLAMRGKPLGVLPLSTAPAKHTEATSVQADAPRQPLPARMAVADGAPPPAGLEVVAPIAPRRSLAAREPARESRRSVALSTESPIRADRVWTPSLAWIAWALPAAWLAARVLASSAACASIVRRATVVTNPHALAQLNNAVSRNGLRPIPVPPLLESPEIASPATIGWHRPTVLLPASWRDWPAEELEAVLAHELAHVARRDVLWQTLARLACAIYWFHPLAWVAAWRMRVEREIACDDGVLRGGATPTGYARWLLDVASGISAKTRDPLSRSAAAVAMADRCGLERRVTAILDPRRPRTPVSRRAAATLSLASLLVVALLAAFNPLAAKPANAHPATASGAKAAAPEPTGKRPHVTGLVRGTDGKPAAGVLVTVADKDVVTGADGRFAADLEGDRISYLQVWARTADGTFQGRFSEFEPEIAQLPGRMSAEVELTLRPARSLEVTVTDATGAPVDGASVRMSATFACVGDATTDAAGHATLRFADAKELDYVMATKPGVGFDYFVFWRPGEAHTDPYRLEQNYAAPVKLVLNGMKQVAIRVTDEHGQPLPGALVYPWLYQKPKKGEDANLGETARLKVESDAQGIARFEVPADLERPVTFWARLKGYQAPKRCEYDPKAAPAELTQVLVRQVVLTGRVVNEKGAPVGGGIVRVGGAGGSIDAFRGETTSAADGTFSMDVSPDMYYVVTADREQLASAPRTQVIRKGAATPVNVGDLVLKPATRVFGRVTGGADAKPIAGGSVTFAFHDGKSYYELPREQWLRDTLTGFSVDPGFSRHMSVSEDGRFETYVGPGSYSVFSYSPIGSASKAMEVIPGQAQQELNLHAAEVKTSPTAAPKTFSGRVVMRDEPARGEADIAIQATMVPDEAMLIQGTSAADGKFTLRSPTAADIYLHAASADRKMQGIALVKHADLTVAGMTIPVGPTGSASGRLVDDVGQPVPAKKIDYAYEVRSPQGLINSVGGSGVTTGTDGSFVLDGLVPGFAYTVNVVVDTDEDGRPRGWRAATKVTVESPAKRLDLGDVKYTAPPRQKTWDEYAADAFKVKDALGERVEKARKVGRYCYQRPMVVFGGPDRPTAKMLGKVRYDFEDRSNEEAENVLVEFVTVSVDLDTTGEDAKALAGRLGVAWPVKESTLVVLGEDGKPVAQTSGEALASDGKPDVKKFIAWARPLALPKPDAQKVLDEALGKAKAEGKRVLVDETSAYCGWCVKLGEYFESNAGLLSKDYVVVSLDRRMPSGKDVLSRLRAAKKEYSTPWMVILDADGKPLADSDAPDGNFGYPDGDSVPHWEKMIHSTATHLTDAEIRRLLQPLKR